ncbi:MAG: hypothetical protein R3F17_14690 [Planctomycetota bacterium]
MTMGPGFAIEVQLAETREGAALDLPAEQVRVDARMPDHRHGMLQAVTVTRIALRHYRVEGMRLHMVGYWEFHVDVRRGAWTERAAFSLEV